MFLRWVFFPAYNLTIIIREDSKFRNIFDRAGLLVVRTELQTGFPKVLLPVRSYALRPMK